MRKLFQNQYISFALLLFFLLLQANICFAEFTIDDEKKVGKEFYDKLASHNILIENKRLNDYITNIGKLILDDNKQVPFEFHFSIVNSSAINAFATPGGYIYVNKGLINNVENEAELAGVIAHEIGHANARHVASIIEKSQKINIATIAAILAGTFLGGGQAAAAIAAFSLAGATTLSLKYSRENEEDADRRGIEYLVKAGYYPEAMVDFMKIMKKYEFLSKTIPSYFLTHPATDERIFYLDSLILTQYRDKKGVKNIVGNLTRIQTLLSLNDNDLDVKYSELKESASKNPKNVDLLYSLAIVEDKLGKTNDALEHFQKALSISPQDEDVLKNLGLINIKLGKDDLAQIYLRRAININPNNDEVMLALGQSLYDTGNYQSALDCFLKLENTNFDEIDINYYIAMAYGRLKNQGESHYYFGLYFKKAKKKESALFHFREALNFFPSGSERAESINKAISDINSHRKNKIAK